MEEGIQTIQKHLQRPAIAASDAHNIKSFGIFAIDFQVEIETEHDLVRAISNHQFTIFRDQAKVDAINAKKTKRLALL